MAALDQMETAPEKAVHVEMLVDEPDLGLAYDSNDATSEDPPDSPNGRVADTGEHSDLLFPTAQRRDNKIKLVIRGLLKPVLAIAASQYALVMALAGLTAYAVASTASKLVKSSFESILAALKRL